LSIFHNKKIPELILEPGRCITGPNQLLLLKIHQVKDRKGLKKWLVADAGIGTLTMLPIMNTMKLFYAMISIEKHQKK